MGGWLGRAAHAACLRCCLCFIASCLPLLLLYAAAAVAAARARPQASASAACCCCCFSCMYCPCRVRGQAKRPPLQVLQEALHQTGLRSNACSGNTAGRSYGHDSTSS